jgi:hypothetical protein
MRAYLKLAAAAGLTASVMFASAPVYAATLVPFATYTMTGTKTTMEWQKAGSDDGSIFSTAVGGSSPGITKFVTFNFLDTSLYLNNLKAELTLNGAEVAHPATANVDEGGIGGSFTFTYEGPTTTFMGKTYTHDVTNLLTGVFTLGHISGTGTSGSFHDSTDIGTVTYTSDIISNLPLAVARDFSFSLVSITPALGFTPGQSLNTFKAGATGIFSAGFVPEPATWAMLITGVGLLGLATRRRRALA